MPNPHEVNITHLAIRVSDLPKSIRFYEDVFGFTPTLGKRVENLEEMLGSDHFSVDVQFLEHPSGPTIELVYAPGTPTERGPHDTVLTYAGWNHMACRVADLDRILEDLIEHGGSVIESSRVTRADGKQVVFVRDPDGTRIELLQYPR